MKIIFDKENYKSGEIINLLIMCRCQSFYKERLVDVGLKENKDISDLINKLIKHVDTENFAYKFLFTLYDNYCFCVNFVNYKVLFGTEKLETVEDYIAFFKNIDHEKIVAEFILSISHFFELQENFLDKTYFEEVSKKVLEEAKQLISNKDYLFEYVEKLEFDDETKWNIIKFLQNPQSYYNEIVTILEKLSPYYKKEIAKFDRKINEFCDELLDKINTQGIECITDYVLDNIDLSKYDTILITPSCLSNYCLSLNAFSNVLYITIGIDTDEYLKTRAAKTNVEANLNILKVISDPIKFKIITQLQKKDLFGKEICELSGISKSLLSYHIDALAVNNIVTFKQEGTKIYYSLNKSTIETAMNAILNELI